MVIDDFLVSLTLSELHTFIASNGKTLMNFEGEKMRW
jgi:hypothetical protein